MDIYRTLKREGRMGMVLSWVPSTQVTPSLRQIGEVPDPQGRGEF